MTRTRRAESVAAKEELLRVKGEFAAWRKRKRGRGRIPEELWEMAAGLVPELGLSKVAGPLGLNHSMLRQRANGLHKTPTALETTFVELCVVEEKGEKPVEVPESGECVVEVKRPDGAAMSIRMRADNGALERMLGAFLEASCSQ